MNATSIATSPPPLRPLTERTASRGQKVEPGDVAVGVIIGRSSEFFDFFVYAIASVLVFPRLIFSHVDPLTGTIFSFAIFALAFVARPLGSVIFMAIDHAWGKGPKLTIALFLLGCSTVAIAFLPSHEQIGGMAIVLLAVCRIGQGLALGGAWDGLPSLLALNAPENRRGWYAMIPQLGAPVGLILAAGLFSYFLSQLSTDEFLSWGWRYPFFVAFAINVVALFARLRIVVTPSYEAAFNHRDLEAAPVGETLNKNGRQIALGSLVPLASFSLFHMVTVFPLSWVLLFTHQDVSRFLVIELVGAVFGFLAIIASGPIADRIGRRALLVEIAIAIAAFSGFAPQLLDGGELGEAIYMVLGFILLGLSFGQSSGSLASAFLPSYRYTASALTSDFAWLCGAGFAPLVALSISSRYGLPFAGAYLLSGAIVTLVALAINRRLAPMNG